MLLVVMLRAQPLINNLHIYNFKTRKYIYCFSLRPNPNAPEAFTNNNNIALCMFQNSVPENIPGKN